MSSNLLSILSARNLSLFAFILVVLFLGATFNVHVGPESFEDAVAKKEVKEGAKPLQKEGLEGVKPHEPMAVNAGVVSASASAKPKPN